MAILLAYMTFCTKADAELIATAAFEADTKITTRKRPKPYGVGVILPFASRISYLYDGMMANVNNTGEFLLWTFCALVSFNSKRFAACKLFFSALKMIGTAQSYRCTCKIQLHLHCVFKILFLDLLLNLEN